jgi:hypothetical protein
MARKNDAPPTLMNMMGLMLFDEEDSKFRLSGEKFAEIMLAFSIILLIVAKFVA